MKICALKDIMQLYVTVMFHFTVTLLPDLAKNIDPTFLLAVTIMSVVLHLHLAFK